ncbi:MAG: NUDIX hydrolase [Propionibacteriaceae bacterium]|jgi:8-oxo-dGTP diphosphatase|nr:NUDIX hydrolase [Propionibacteriaceae bacterium]
MGSRRARARSGSIQAAGAVVWRRVGSEPEVALVHRPKYDDWSLPKGKAKAGESLSETAIREVAEETGWRIRLGPPLSPTRYLTESGPKQVSYWLGHPLEAQTRPPDDEVDQVAWLPLDRARARLTYADERVVLAEAVALALQLDAAAPEEWS